MDWKEIWAYIKPLKSWKKIVLAISVAATLIAIMVSCNVAHGVTQTYRNMTTGEEIEIKYEQIGQGAKQ